MKVTVSKYLNVRVGAPDINADCYQYLAPGSIIEVEDRLYDGKDFRGNTKWFRDKYNNYYWSGGVLNNSTVEVDDDLVGLPWNIKKFGIHELWSRSKGENVDIAVLDTGCYDHQNFKNQIKSKRNFLSLNTDVQDYSGHGTHVTGIIASNGKNKVFGVSPKVRLHIGKVAHGTKDGLNPDVVASAINWYSNKVDIISMSLGFEIEEPIVRDAVKNCKALIVAAFGNDEEQIRNSGDYPALYGTCLSVGSLKYTNNRVLLSNDTIRKSGLNITAPGVDIFSTYLNDGYETLSGSSMATPYVSGTLALLKSLNKQKDIHELKEDIIQSSIVITDQNFTYNQLNISKF